MKSLLRNRVYGWSKLKRDLTEIKTMGAEMRERVRTEKNKCLKAQANVPGGHARR